MKGDKRKKKSWISVRLLTTPILLALPEATNIYYSETPKSHLQIAHTNMKIC